MTTVWAFPSTSPTHNSVDGNHSHRDRLTSGSSFRPWRQIWSYRAEGNRDLSRWSRTFDALQDRCQLFLSVSFVRFFFAGWLPAFCFFGVSRANQLAMLGSVRIRNSTFTVRRSVILLLPLTALSSAFVFPWMSRLVRTTAVLRALRRSGRSDSMPVVRWFGPTRRDLVGLLTTACRFCYCRRCWIAAAAARACVFR